jgi:hypothetical protein
MGNPSESHWDKSPLSQPRPSASPFSSPRYARRQSLYPSPSSSYSNSALCSNQITPSIALNLMSPSKSGADENNGGGNGRNNDRFGYQGMNSDDREDHCDPDVCQSYSSRRSSLTSMSQQGLNKSSSGQNTHPHKWWKPFSYAPSSVSARSAVRRNSNSSVKLVPPRITKTQYPENV